MPIPVGLSLATVEEAAAWARTTLPPDGREMRFRLIYRDTDGSGGGRGRVRLAVPDSVRFDFQGSLGSVRANAFVAGDTAIWAEPEDEVKKLVPNYPLFWAMLGIARAPGPAAQVKRVADGTITAWQFIEQGDTVEYVREGAPAGRLIAEVRQGRRRIGRVETVFGPDGLPASARLIVPEREGRLDLTFTQNQKASGFAPDTWTRPAPQ